MISNNNVFFCRFEFHYITRIPSMAGSLQASAQSPVNSATLSCNLLVNLRLTPLLRVYQNISCNLLHTDHLIPDLSRDLWTIHSSSSTSIIETSLAVISFISGTLLNLDWPYYQPAFSCTVFRGSHRAGRGCSDRAEIDNQNKATPLSWGISPVNIQLLVGVSGLEP